MPKQIASLHWIRRMETLKRLFFPSKKCQWDLCLEEY